MIVNHPQVAEGLSGGKWCSFGGQLYVDNGVLYCLFSGSEVVPESQKERVLYGVHEGIGGGHLGVEKSVTKLKE